MPYSFTVTPGALNPTEAAAGSDAWHPPEWTATALTAITVPADISGIQSTLLDDSGNALTPSSEMPMPGLPFLITPV